jgi:LAGLIDADG endonuclease
VIDQLLSLLYPRRLQARKSNGKWEIRSTFEILVDLKHKEILDPIHNFFGVGKIYVQEKNVYYRVTRMIDLNNIIIPHFKSFPLLTRKRVNFIISRPLLYFFFIKKN